MASQVLTVAPRALNLELRVVHEDPFRQILPGQSPGKPGSLGKPTDSMGGNHVINQLYKNIRMCIYNHIYIIYNCIYIPYLYIYCEIGGWFVASIFFRHPVFGTFPEHLQARKNTTATQHSQRKMGKTTD